MDDFDPVTGTILDDIFDDSGALRGLGDCRYVVPDENGHVPWGACRGYYLFYPSQAGNAVFAVLFALVTLVHFQQMCHYRKVREPREQGILEPLNTATNKDSSTASSLSLRALWSSSLSS